MAIIGTQSLSQLVNVNSKQSGLGELRKAVFDVEKEPLFLKNFSPMSPQLEAIKVACECAATGGSVLFSGPCGTGKTSLLYMLSKLLITPTPSDNLSAFTSALSDVSVVRSLSAVRTVGHKWLCVIPDTLKDDNFYTSVHSALNGALFGQGAAEFVPKDATIAEEIAETAEFLRSKSTLEGLLIVCDQAEALLEAIARRPESPIAQQFSALAKLAIKSSFPILLVVACDCEMDGFTLEEENRILEFFRKVQPVSILGRVGEWEEIVGHNLLSHNEGPSWQEVISYKDFRAVTESLVRVGLYQGTSDKWINEVVMQGAYPLHPSALFALPRVALCLAARGKTAFDFFSDASPGGFVYFLRNFAVIQPNGRLHLYTADSLYTYFEKAIQDDAINSEYSKALQKAVMLAGDIPQARRILRMILIIQMVGHDRFRSNLEHIIWAMHLGEKETRVATNSLELLTQKGALAFDKSSGEYTLPVERSRMTLEEALPRALNRVRSQFDLCSAVRSSLPWKRILASKFNEKYACDRQAFVRVIAASDLADSALFLNKVNEAVFQVHPYRGDLLLALVIPQNETELETLRSDLQAGKLSHPRLMIVLPAASSFLAKEAMEMMALDRLMSFEPPFNDSASSEHEKVKKLYEKAKKKYSDSMSLLIDPAHLDFYYDGTKVEDINSDNLITFVDEKVTALVGPSPILNNRDLTTLKDSGHTRRTRQGLINYLLSCRGHIAVRADLTEIVELIDSGLVNTGIISQEGREGNWIRYQVTKEVPDNAVGKAFSLLQEQLVGGPGVNLDVAAKEVITPLLSAPYGLTPSMLELLLAVLLWKSPRSLSLGRNLMRANAESRSDLVEFVTPSAEAIFALVSNTNDWIFRYRDCSTSQEYFLKGVLEYLNVSQYNEPTLWLTVHAALGEFYRTLPAAAKVLGASGNPKVDVWLKFLADEKTETRLALEVELPELLGRGQDFSWESGNESLLAVVLSCCESLRSLVATRQQALETGLGKLLDVDSTMEGSDWHASVVRWLRNVQNTFVPACWQDDLQALSASASAVAPEAMSQLLRSLGYGDIEQWPQDYTGEILERFWDLREDIEWSGYRSPCQYTEASRTAGGIAAAVLGGSELSNLEDFLASELQWSTWPESVEVEPSHAGSEDDWLMGSSSEVSEEVSATSVSSKTGFDDDLLNDETFKTEEVEAVAVKKDEKAISHPEPVISEPVAAETPSQDKEPELEKVAVEAEEANSTSGQDDDILMTDLDEPTLQWL